MWKKLTNAQVNESVKVELKKKIPDCFESIESTTGESVHANELWASKQMAKRLKHQHSSVITQALMNWWIKNHLQLRINPRINNGNASPPTPRLFRCTWRPTERIMRCSMWLCSLLHISQPSRSPAVSDRNTHLLPWWLSPANQGPCVCVCVFIARFNTRLIMHRVFSVWKHTSSTFNSLSLSPSYARDL